MISSPVRMLSLTVWICAVGCLAITHISVSVRTHRVFLLLSFAVLFAQQPRVFAFLHCSVITPRLHKLNTKAPWVKKKKKKKKKREKAQSSSHLFGLFVTSYLFLAVFSRLLNIWTAFYVIEHCVTTCFVSVSWWRR